MIYRVSGTWSGQPFWVDVRDGQVSGTPAAAGPLLTGVSLGDMVTVKPQPSESMPVDLDDRATVQAWFGRRPEVTRVQVEPPVPLQTRSIPSGLVASGDSDDLPLVLMYGVEPGQARSLTRRVEATGATPEKDLHVTVQYLGEPPSGPSGRAAWAGPLGPAMDSDLFPMDIDTAGAGYFEPGPHSDGQYPVVIHLKPDDRVLKIRDELAEAGLPDASSFPEFKPHVTLTYTDTEDDAARVVKAVRVPPQVRFDRAIPIDWPPIAAAGWNALLHPRDMRGRFIHVGDRVRVKDSGGDMWGGEVTGITGTGQLEVRRLSDDSVSVQPPSAITVIRSKARIEEPSPEVEAPEAEAIQTLAEQAQTRTVRLAAPREEIDPALARTRAERIEAIRPQVVTGLQSFDVNTVGRKRTYADLEAAVPVDRGVDEVSDWLEFYRAAMHPDSPQTKTIPIPSTERIPGKRATEVRTILGKGITPRKAQSNVSGPILSVVQMAQALAAQWDEDHDQFARLTDDTYGRRPPYLAKVHKDIAALQQAMRIAWNYEDRPRDPEALELLQRAVGGEYGRLTPEEGKQVLRNILDDRAQTMLEGLADARDRWQQQRDSWRKTVDPSWTIDGPRGGYFLADDGGPPADLTAANAELIRVGMLVQDEIERRMVEDGFGPTGGLSPEVAARGAAGIRLSQLVSEYRTRLFDQYNQDTLKGWLDQGLIDQQAYDQAMALDPDSRKYRILLWAKPGWTAPDDSMMRKYLDGRKKIGDADPTLQKLLDLQQQNSQKELANPPRTDGRFALARHTRQVMEDLGVVYGPPDDVRQPYAFLVSGSGAAAYQQKTQATMDQAFQLVPQPVLRRIWSGSRRITVAPRKSRASRSAHELNAPRGMGASTAIHEEHHGLEFQHKWVGAMEWAMLTDIVSEGPVGMRKRKAGKKWQHRKLSTLHAGSGYKANEYGLEDDLWESYAGKTYEPGYEQDFRAGGLGGEYAAKGTPNNYEFLTMTSEAVAGAGSERDLSDDMEPEKIEQSRRGRGWYLGLVLKMSVDDGQVTSAAPAAGGEAAF